MLVLISPILSSAAHACAEDGAQISAAASGPALLLAARENDSTDLSPFCDSHDCSCPGHNSCPCHVGVAWSRATVSDFAFENSALTYAERAQSACGEPDLEGPFQPPRAA